MQGVPRQWRNLPAKEKAVAEAMIEEFGAGAFIGTGQRYNMRLNQLMAVLLITLDTRLEEGAEADVVVQAVRRDLANFSRRAEIIAKTATDEGISVAREAHLRGIGRASSITGVTADADFSEFTSLVKDRAALRRVYRRPIEEVLRQKAIVEANSVEAFIRSGRPMKEVSSELITALAKNKPAIKDALSDLGRRGKFIREGIEKLAGQIQGLEGQGLHAKARATLTHGLNAMHHEALLLGYEKSPMVGTLRWKLSPSHHTHRSSPDVCDILAMVNPTGKGPGHYYPETCPGLPHRYCTCGVEAIYRDPSEWGTYRGRQNSPRRLVPSDFESDLENRSRDDSPTITDARLRDQVGRADRVLQIAHKAFWKWGGQSPVESRMSR